MHSTQSNRTLLSSDLLRDPSILSAFFNINDSRSFASLFGASILLPAARSVQYIIESSGKDPGLPLIMNFVAALLPLGYAGAYVGVKPVRCPR